MKKLTLIITSILFYGLFTFQCQNVVDNDKLIDYHNYAPLEIGNTWTYIQKCHYSNTCCIDTTINKKSYNSKVSFFIDTIQIEVVKCNKKINQVIVNRTVISIDSSQYSFGQNSSIILDTTIIVNDFYKYTDTLYISGDTILSFFQMSPKHLYLMSDGPIPFFFMKDYSDYDKKEVEFYGKKLYMVSGFRGSPPWIYSGNFHYLDTYGLLYWSDYFLGTGIFWGKSVRLVKFKDEIIDSSAIAAIAYEGFGAP